MALKRRTVDRISDITDLLIDIQLAYADAAGDEDDLMKSMTKSELDKLEEVIKLFQKAIDDERNGRSSSK